MAPVDANGQVLSRSTPGPDATPPQTVSPLESPAVSQTQAGEEIAPLEDEVTHESARGSRSIVACPGAEETAPSRKAEVTTPVAMPALEAWRGSDVVPAVAAGATAGLHALDLAVSELVDELNDLGEQFADLLAGGRSAPMTAAVAGMAAAGIAELRLRRKRPVRIKEGNWIWLYSDLLGDAPGEEP
jgi:hypothetical protein